MLTPLTLFDDWFNPRHSIYVISDTQLAEYKRNQAEAEIIEIDKLIEGHEHSIERLKSTRTRMREEYPVLTPSEDK